MKEPQPPAAVGRHNVTKNRPDDAEVPAGDSPPRSVWPLVVGVAVWLAWIGFLLAMMVVRTKTTAV
jgi:hypothetical protein